MSISPPSPPQPRASASPVRCRRVPGSMRWPFHCAPPRSLAPRRSGPRRSPPPATAFPRPRKWAGCSRYWRSARQTGRSPPGSDMSDFTYRTATPEDAPLMSRIGAQTFRDTFGHLYTPENLAAFLENHSEENWLAELNDPALTIRLAEQDGETIGFAKVGPH